MITEVFKITRLVISGIVAMFISGALSIFALLTYPDFFSIKYNFLSESIRIDGKAGFIDIYLCSASESELNKIYSKNYKSKIKFKNAAIIKHINARISINEDGKTLYCRGIARIAPTASRDIFVSWPDRQNGLELLTIEPLTNKIFIGILMLVGSFLLSIVLCQIGFQQRSRRAKGAPGGL